MSAGVLTTDKIQRGEENPISNGSSPRSTLANCQMDAKMYHELSDGKAESQQGSVAQQNSRQQSQLSEQLGSGGKVTLSGNSGGMGWAATCAWAMFVIWVYGTLQQALIHTLESSEEARVLLMQQVPLRIYYYSEAAFFTAMVLNLIALVFEDTSEKRQLALLTAVIKGISWHCDHLIVTSRAVVTFDSYGAVFVPSRYVQWSCSTPTMIFTLSRISDLQGWDIALTMLADWMIMSTGYASCVLGQPWSGIALLVSCVCFVFVLHMQWRMISSAMAEANEGHSKKCLWVTFGITLAVWNLFPIAWVLGRMGPSFSRWAEPILVFSNFSAKVAFSSCLLYNNYITIGQRRRAAQLAREHQERIQAVADLTDALKRKEEFISVVGHELRTPLNAIVQLSNALSMGAGGPLYERGRAWLDTIRSSANHLMGIINDIVIVRAIRSGTIQIKQGIVDVGQVLDHVVGTLTPLVKRDVVLEKMTHDKLPPLVGDSRRIIQAISNVLGNALKFTEKGKVVIKAYPDKAARYVVIKVTDTGCGIPPEKLPLIFQAFQQADMTASRKYGGTGIGLSIAKQLVDAHGGELRVRSEVGKGSSFKIKMPVLQPDTWGELETEFRQAYCSMGFDYNRLLMPTMESGRLVTMGFSSAGSSSMRRSASMQSRMNMSQFHRNTSLNDSAYANNSVKSRLSGGDMGTRSSMDSGTMYFNPPPAAAPRIPPTAGTGAGPSPLGAHIAHTSGSPLGPRCNKGPAPAPAQPAPASSKPAAGSAAGAASNPVQLPQGAGTGDVAALQTSPFALQGGQLPRPAPHDRQRMSLGKEGCGGQYQSSNRNSTSSRGSSVDMSQALVEHYKWSIDMGQHAPVDEEGCPSEADMDELDELAQFSAAAGDTGAPALAVALMSSIYGSQDSGCKAVDALARAGSTVRVETGRLSESDDEAELLAAGSPPSIPRAHSLGPMAMLDVTSGSHACGSAMQEGAGLGDLYGGVHTLEPSGTGSHACVDESSISLLYQQALEANDVVLVQQMKEAFASAPSYLGGAQLRPEDDRSRIRASMDPYADAGRRASMQAEQYHSSINEWNTWRNSTVAEGIEEGVEEEAPAKPKTTAPPQPKQKSTGRISWQAWVARIPDHHKKKDA